MSQIHEGWRLSNWPKRGENREYLGQNHKFCTFLKDSVMKSYLSSVTSLKNRYVPYSFELNAFFK